jgi:type VI protein secretion system component Hcp
LDGEAYESGWELKRMIILARVTNVLQNHQSRLKGYELGWFLLDKLDYKITGTSRESLGENGGNGAGSGSMMLGGGKFETLKITKVVNGATPILMFKTCQGELIKKFEVQVVETRDLGPGQGSSKIHQVQNYPVFLLRFENLTITSWDIEIEVGSMVEKVEFRYRKVACEYRKLDIGDGEGIYNKQVGADGKVTWNKAGSASTMTYNRAASKGWMIEDDRGAEVPGKEWVYEFKVRGDV